MKLEHTNTEQMDMGQMLEEAYEQEQSFWQDVERYVMHGVPATDEKGHWVEIRVRVRPSQLDLITGLREKHPAGLYKSQADLIRSLLSTGCKTHLEFFKKRKSTQWGELVKILEALNILGRQHRLQELKTDVQKAMSMTVNGSSTPEEKSKVVDLLGQMEKKIIHL